MPGDIQEWIGFCLAGGLHHFRRQRFAAIVIAGGQLSLVLGGGLAVSDFGIERSNGEPWPVISFPGEDELQRRVD